MSKKEMFFNLCKIMANMEDAISTFSKLGFVVEPDESVGLDLYDTASVAYRIASSLLNVTDYEIETEIFDKLMPANLETVDKIAQEVWDKYGSN